MKEKTREVSGDTAMIALSSVLHDLCQLSSCNTCFGVQIRKNQLRFLLF